MTRRDPLPSYAGLQTFMRAPVVDAGELDASMIAVFGAPFEVSTRYGARLGPKVIREQSTHFQYYIESDANAEIVDVDTGRLLRPKRSKRIVDLGDVNIYPMDVAKTGASITRMVDDIATAGAFPVMLGGDHFITFPAVRGLHDAVRRKKSNARIGYIHLDAHFDIGDDNALYGRLNNATIVRRIMELPGVDPRNISMVGIRGIARKSQVDLTRASGINYYPMPEVRKRGLESVMREAIEKASDGCDAVYATFDIDVVDVIHAPGNGGIMFGGLSASEALRVADMLAECNVIGGFDINEVNANYDISDITAKLGATVVFKFLMPKLFDISTEAA